MRDYIERDRKKRLKGYILSIIFILLVFIICLLSYYIYLKIDIYADSNEEELPTKIARMSQTIEENNKEENNNITSVIKKVNETVVGISKVKEAGESIFLQEGVSKLGLGTGIIVSENGYILTNEHVSGKKNSTCYITLNTGKTYTGTVLWSNSDIDMAIIKINEKNLKYALLGDSDKVNVGENVYAIGNPIGYEFQRTVTSGIISAKDRTIKLEENGEEIYMEDLIQTDATINPGNSGGPLIRKNGEVIGINSVKITSAEGIGFAVPINTVKSVIENFIKYGKFEEARLGIYAYDTDVIPYMKAESEIGIYITRVVEKTAAQRVGIKKNDIIISIDGQNLERMCELRRYIYTKKPKDEVNLKILRNNREIEMKVKLEKK